jgi:hypothetical protein
MTDLEKAARQALDAMEAALDESVHGNHISCRAILTTQIDALQTALEKQAEPVDKALTNAGPQVDKEQAEPVPELDAQSRHMHDLLDKLDKL